jgi:Type II secretion system (T2SS), protein M subtype b
MWDLLKQLRKTAALGILTTLLCLSAYGFGIWQFWTSNRDMANQDLLELDHLRSIAQFKNKLSTFDGESAFDAVFLGKGTPAILSADLIAKLKTMASSTGVEVLQANSVAAKVEGPLTLIGGNLQVTGNWPAITAFLQQAEQATPVLVVDRIALRSNMAPGSEDQSDTMLQADMDIFGAVRTSETSAQTGASQ